MRKLFCSGLVVASLLLASFNLRAQVYNGDLNLTTQAQVDAFNFTSVTGKLILFSTSISNLNGLSELQSVGGQFELSGTAIDNIDALTNLQSIGSLLIRGNSLLTNLNGFSALTTAPGNLSFQNNRLLVNFDGLLSLTGVITGIEISNCAMSNLNGFSSISDITGFVNMEANPSLANLDGLEGLLGAGVVDAIKIIDNPLLQNINGLLSIKDAGGIIITGNRILPNVDGLGNLNTVASMIIGQNPALSNIDSLSNIQTMAGSLWIRSNSSLANINGLGSLTTIGKELIIDFNASLTNIDGLMNLTTISTNPATVGSNLIISGNLHLANLNGLQNLTKIGNDLKITSNRDLVDFCGLFKLFDEGTIGGIVEIKNNGANTVSLTPTNVTVNADPGVCSAVILTTTISTPTVNGCLKPGTPTHTDFPAGNIYPVGITNIIWTVTDAAGNTATAVQAITVVDNQVPVITCPGNLNLKCASDVPDVDVNSVTATDNCSATVTHVGDVITNQTCANRFTLTRTYKATDPAGNSATCSQIITVYDDIPPQINGLAASKTALWPPNHKMQDITLTYTVTDNCSNTPTISVLVSSNESENGTGDGDSDSDWEIVDDHHVRLRAERAANGDGRIYTITVTVDDGCNPLVSQTKQVMVAHNITGPQSGKPFKVGSIVNFSGVFQDKPGKTHTGKWLLDGNVAANGTIIEPVGNLNGKVTGSYKFNTPGVYKLQMNVIDQTGAISYANTNGDVDAIVVIYDPNGGNTYGGGYYNSPAGALESNPTATGKASYGFAMNYFKNSTNPKGETQFEFKVGNFEFNALNFEYLVISNSMAQFKGTGKIIGGQSGIGFTMTVTDGQIDGSGIDKIRMKIYNKNNGSIIYDNQPGANDATLPAQAVGANSLIVINGTNSSLTSANTNQKAEMETKAPEVLNDLDVIAFPNPSTNNFTINVNAKTNEKITMQVVDMYGRIIETRNVTVNSLIKFGDRYTAGTYFVRVIQGKQHKEIKLIKFPD